jgi:septal ring factor EnvC (AmiA/AmiB activator)
MSSISRGILARYLLWRQPKIKLLLNESDVNAISRNIRYHDYFIKAYTGRVETIRRELDQLEAVESALKLEADKLRLTRLGSDKHLVSLIALQKKRGLAVSELQIRLERREQALAQLKLDEQRLQSLVEEIGDALVRAPAGAGLAPFSELKGVLQWPTTGDVVKAPGDSLREGGAQWSGVVIESEPGAEVAAVGSGMVVFVDWFRNLGLLIIIDHGGGYMSLYGHNQSVQVEAGAWVEPGQIISYVGDTGGRTHSGLYFEIRHDGQPQDPRQWCAAR